MHSCMLHKGDEKGGRRRDGSTGLHDLYTRGFRKLMGEKRDNEKNAKRIGRARRGELRNV